MSGDGNAEMRYVRVLSECRERRKNNEDSCCTELLQWFVGSIHCINGDRKEEKTVKNGWVESEKTQEKIIFKHLACERARARAHP